MACGCLDSCSCFLEGSAGITVVGSGTISSPWIISPPPETVFAASSIDGSITVVAAGDYGHTPGFAVNIDPSGTAPVTVGPSGIKIDCCTSSADNPVFVVVNTPLDYLALDQNMVILADISANDVTVSLPSVHTSGRMIIVKDATGSVGGAFDLVVDSDDGDSIDTALSYTFSTPYESLQFVSDGNDWFVV